VQSPTHEVCRTRQAHAWGAEGVIPIGDSAGVTSVLDSHARSTTPAIQVAATN
jgi:hypothetical protein